ncbi:WD40 repeat domain-containing protein [Roseibium album]|uniref:WD40 repeat domain-containing protein n=1 Tax=Roseibium album TaxID=311410 RepID=UPI003297EE08
MKKIVKIIIPTTDGPSEVVFLGREDPALGRSTACLNGTTTLLGINRDYSRFVQQPTGLIERLYGHGAFRMDVSAQIEAGSSWQLGTLVAHAAEAEGRLAQSIGAAGSVPDCLIWATGQVRPLDLAIGEVGHVEDKLTNSIDMLEQAASEMEVHVVLPASNADDISQMQRDRLSAAGIQFHATSDVIALFEQLGLAVPHLAASSGPTVPTWTEEAFRGLEPYRPEHRPIFCGRDRAREECLEQLRSSAVQGRAFLMVHGRSGVGKSSLIGAGLIGDIEERAREGGEWQTVHLSFAETEGAPLAALARALTDSLDPDSKSVFLKEFASNPVATVLGALPEGTSLLIALDQFEQALLTDAGSNEMIAEFADVIEKLSMSGPVWIIGAIRTDQLELLGNHAALARLASGTRLYRLEMPSLFELIEMMVQPAALTGLRFATDKAGRSLAEELAEIAASSPDSLPLLQIVLVGLARHAEDGVITRESYERLGGFEGAVGRWADETTKRLAGLGISDAEIDRFLGELVRVEPGTGVVLSRKAAIHGGEPTRARIVKEMLAARLLVPAGSDTLHIAHEALIRNWPRMGAVAERLRSALILRDELETAAELWSRGGRDKGDLITQQGRLENAEALADQGGLDLDETLRSYISTSRSRFDAAKAISSRRRTGSFAALICLTVLALATSFYFLNLYTRLNLTVDEKNTLNEELKVERDAALERKAEYGALLSDKDKIEYARLELEQRVTNFEARTNLRLAKERLSDGIPHEAIAFAVRALPDENANGELSHPQIEGLAAILASALRENRLIWRARRVEIGHEGRSTRKWILPDARGVLSLSADGSLSVWDPIKKQQRYTLVSDEEDPVVLFEPSLDGRHVIVATREGVIRIFDTKTGEQRGIDVHVSGETCRLAVSSNGKHAIISTRGENSNLLRFWENDWENGRYFDERGRLQRYACYRYVQFDPQDRLRMLRLDPKDDEQVYMLGETKPLSIEEGQPKNDQSWHFPSAFDQSGRYVISSRRDGVRVWDTHEQQIVSLYSEYSPSDRFLPGPLALLNVRDKDGDRKLLGFAVVSGMDIEGSILHVWDVERNEKIRTLDFPSHLRAIAVYNEPGSPKLGFLAAFDARADATVWDLDTGKKISKHIVGTPIFNASYSPTRPQIGFADNGETLYVMTSAGEMGAFDLRERPPPTASEGLGGINSPVKGLAVSPDGRYIAIGGRFGVVLHDLESPIKDIVTLVEDDPQSEISVENFAFTADSKALVILQELDRGYKNQLRVFATSDGRELRSYPVLDRNMCCMDLEQSIVTIRDEDDAFVYDLNNISDQPVLTISGKWQPNTRHWLRSAAISPDGAFVAVGSVHGTIEIWSANKRSLERTIEAGMGNHIDRLGFSPDGYTLYALIGANNRQHDAEKVFVWDLEGGPDPTVLPMPTKVDNIWQFLAESGGKRFMADLFGGHTYSRDIFAIWTDGKLTATKTKLDLGNWVKVPDATILIGRTSGPDSKLTVYDYENDIIVDRFGSRSVLDFGSRNVLAVAPDGTWFAYPVQTSEDTEKIVIHAMPDLYAKFDEARRIADKQVSLTQQDLCDVQALPGDECD